MKENSRRRQLARLAVWSLNGSAIEGAVEGVTEAVRVH